MTASCLSSFSTDGVFVNEKRVMFSHCDPAGIVFFPQYFVMLNDLVEDWFRESLKIEMVSGFMAEGYGLPAARLEYEFHSPSRVGDILQQRLSVERIGNSSLTLRVRFDCGDTPRISGRSILVLVDKATVKPVPIPAHLRERLNAFMGVRA
jgi:4-hydroxybenzoyl-CoA thioesterase